MIIRTYQPGDEEKIIQLSDKVLKEFGFAFSFQLDRDVLDISKYYTRRNGQYFVLVHDGDSGKEEIIGTIAVSKINEKICKLRHFYILKQFRHHGWGRKLYEEALEFIRSAGYREIWLSTAPQFADAIHFYEHNGFVRSPKALWPYQRAGIFYTLKL